MVLGLLLSHQRIGECADALQKQQHATSRQPHGLGLHLAIFYPCTSFSHFVSRFCEWSKMPCNFCMPEVPSYPIIREACPTYINVIETTPGLNKGC